MLRSHQSTAKPCKEKESWDTEKCLGFNNNENDGEENVNETETSEEMLDLRLELDEEELLAQNDEDKKWNQETNPPKSKQLTVMIKKSEYFCLGIKCVGVGV